MLKQAGALDAADLGRELLSAAREGDYVEVQAVLRQGVDVNFAGAHGQTALFLASEEGHSSVVTLLIENGADVDQRSGNSATALIIGAAAGRCDVVEALLRAGADVNMVFRLGDVHSTALLEAAHNGHADVVAALLDAGAHTDVRDSWGRSPLDLGKEFGHQDVVGVLKSRSRWLTMRKWSAGLGGLLVVLIAWGLLRRKLGNRSNEEGP